MATQAHKNDNQLLLSLEAALSAEDISQAAQLLQQAKHPTTIAHTLEAFPWEQRRQIWQLLDSKRRGAVLIELHEEVQDGLIKESAPTGLIETVSDLDLDELADLYERLPINVRTPILQTMDEQRRQRFEAVRRFPDNTAGGLMDADAITVRSDTTLNAVLRFLRKTRHQYGKLPEHMDAVIVVDRDYHYLGMLPLSDLVSLEGSSITAAVMDTTIDPIPARMPAKKVARQFEDYDLLSAPVIEEDGRLIGRITVDDIVDVIREEANHTLMIQAGLEEENDMFAPILSTARRRVIWLGINLINGFIAAWVIGQFEHSIQDLVALAVLMPIVASMGGSAGTQTLTLVTRGIALEQVGASNIGRLLKKELGVILVNAFLLALVVTAIALIWYQAINLGIIFALALMINLLNGALAGTFIPFVLHKLGIDPALAGGVILIATTDALGFFTFLSLATAFLL